jgi:hypothetical protein
VGRVDRRAGLALAAATITAAVAAAPADAAVERYTLRHGPVAIGGFQVKFPRVEVPTPKVDGHIVRMHARLVDARGRRVSIRDVMLHHLVFRRRWRPGNKLPCRSRRGEAFYGTGEENQRLDLPAGYGYRITRRDRWRITAMLMSHALKVRRVYIQYRVTVDTSGRLTPVRAFWVRANGCGPSISYPVPGGGPPGSTNLRRFTWRMPYAGRIVAASGHLHGGAKDMWLSQPRCGNRRLLHTRPFYAPPDHPYYTARPILHEPGPFDTSAFRSRTGIPVRRGERLRLTGAYDGQLPHTRVMSIMHVYVARGPAPRACAPLPVDRRQTRRYERYRPEPPQVRVPLNRLDERGRTYELLEPPWPARRLRRRGTVAVRDDGFSPPHVRLRAGSRLTWRFTGAGRHNVVFANGPSLVGSPTLRRGQRHTTRFRVPGRYELYCYLHPVTMHQVVDVR